MPRVLKKLIHGVTGLPVVSNAIRLANSGPAVLFYHGVEEQLTNPKVQFLHLPLADFEKQILHLRKWCEIVSLDEVYDNISNSRQMDPRQLAITFDDGYRNNLEIVEPFLSSYDIPFAVFVSTRHISEGLRFASYYVRAAVYESTAPQITVLGERLDISTDVSRRRVMQALLKQIKTQKQDTVDEIVQDLIRSMPADRWAELNERFSSDQPMNWDDVKELGQRGVTIGSHCHDHLILHDKQCINEIDRQLRTSKELLQQHVGDCRYIAYPNGGMNDLSQEAVNRVSRYYSAGFMTVAGEVQPDTNRYVLPRICGDTTEMGRFRFAVNARFRHNRRNRSWMSAAGFQDAELPA
jgi:peptidoglycan/xylan/chitin deacetylase (PgdA/CDA1 family)